MAVEIIMPKLGLTMTTGTVVKWLKKEGDHVRKGEELLEISTEKIVNTVESPADGVLLKIVAPEGTELPIAGLLGYVGVAGEKIDTVTGDVPVGEEILCSPAIVFQGTCGQDDETTAETKKRVKITPVAMKLAKELNVDYTLIPGTGPGGRITREDVENFVAQAQNAQKEKTVTPAVTVTEDSGTALDYDMLPYAGMRKVIGENMSKSWTLAPKVTEHVSADVSRLVELRKMINQGLREGEAKVSITDLLVKILAKSLELKPMLNVSLEGGTIKVMKNINVGVAVSLETGLMVPVVKNANRKSIYQVSKEVKELVRKAREGMLSMDEMSGGTFTISNLGTYGSVDYFTPIINQPESAILGIGRIVETPVVVDGQIVARPMMGLSLAFDHRVIDGAPAAEFLALLISLIADPLRAILSP